MSSTIDHGSNGALPRMFSSAASKRDTAGGIRATGPPGFKHGPGLNKKLISNSHPAKQAKRPKQAQLSASG